MDTVLSPEVVRRTRRILTLQKREKGTAARLATVVADIGDELIAVKAALDRGPDKTAWTAWLRRHVRYSNDTAQNYMRLARLRRKKPNRFGFFSSRLNVSCLFRLASLPDELQDAVDPDAFMPVPGATPKRVDEMSRREFDRALDGLEQRTPRAKRPPPVEGPAGADRDAYVTAAAAALVDWTGELLDVRTLPGKLSPDVKLRYLDAVESARRWGLKLPRWAFRRKTR